MHLQIGPVSLAPLERTADFSIRPRMDDTGLDVLWYELSGAVECVWSPFAVATATAPVAPAPGDSLGITVRNLRTILMQPKQQITLTIGPDRVIQAPLSGPFAVGLVLPVDPAGGPMVDDVKILENMGDYTARVLVRFHLSYNDDSAVCVSNRWTVRCVTDAKSWLTTRYITGLAVLRADFLQTMNSPNLDPSIVPDQMRRAFILPCPLGFMRQTVDVVATPDGARLRYVCVDQQMAKHLGNSQGAGNFGVTHIRGDVTVGLDFPFKALWGGQAGFLGAGAALAGQNVAHWALGQAQWWAGAFTTPKGKVVVQVTGNVNSTTANRAFIAVQVAMDRLSPLALAGQIIFVSSYITDSFNSDGAPLTQLSMEVLPLGANAFAALQNPQNVNAMLNGSSSILFDKNLPVPALAGQPIASTDPAFGNPRLPASNNTRGTYVAMMVSQVLATGSVAAGTYDPVGDTPGDGVPVRNELDLG